MRHPNTRALYDYWNCLCDGRDAPYRSEVDPREIAPLLDSTFILEVQNPDSIRFRLAGTRLCENFGMELRGMSALALWHGESRSRVHDMIEAVTEEPCIGHINCTVENRGGFVYQAEFLYMPLRSDMGEMTRILGCGYYMGEERAFANLYDPIHHWVDQVNLYEVEASPDAIPQPSEALMKDAPLEATTGYKSMGTPILTAIEGGRRDPKPDIVMKKRGHLRLVK